MIRIVVVFYCTTEFLLIPFHPFGFCHLEWFALLQWEQSKPVLCQSLYSFKLRCKDFYYVLPPLVGNNKGHKTNMESYVWIILLNGLIEIFLTFSFLTMTHNFPSEFNEKKVGSPDAFWRIPLQGLSEYSKNVA